MYRHVPHEQQRLPAEESRLRRKTWLAGRAIVSFLVLPGVVAGLVPRLIVSESGWGVGCPVWLARTFPVEWAAYRASVPRWVPRFRR
jgi:hypothetical protein